MRASAEEGEASGISASASASATDGATGTDGATDSASASASATQGSASATMGSASAATEADSGNSNSAGEGPKFDLGAQPDVDLHCGTGKGGGGGGTDFSYIWIANSNESTVSKINTETLVEEGRYITRPDSNGNPSRTSVNLNGDMAIGNRNGGVTMIYALHDNCPDASNTSSGAGDVKPWPDGCVGWHTPMAYVSQRPVAWTTGVWNDQLCRWDDTKVWTSGANDPLIDVVLLDGETGTVEQTVPLPPEVIAGYYGIYGGAVNSDNDFWGSQLGQGHIVRVDFANYDVETFPMATSGYGMAVDRNDRVWTCSYEVGRYDYDAGTWQTAQVGGGGGCMPDGQDLIWLANDPMVGVDIETLAVVQSLDVPNYVHGVSIDFNGYVWGPAIYNNEAYRVDPATGQVDVVPGLNFPYTYSDMTGFGLSQVGNPSG
ncbi:MAG: hypothetical protein K1X88_28050 [Nannocystaceae bacterium]|nr:hypothetical protein [Nannocystaceae bacterium]